jgi:hypothetical protein
MIAASIIRVMMEAASISEMLVNFYQTTWHNNPEDSHHHFTCVVDKPNKKYSQVVD